jgi:hypothetical protein
MGGIRHTRERLEPIVKSSNTWREVCEKLELSSRSGNQCHLKKQAEKFDIDFSHFIESNWNKGKTYSVVPLQDYLNNIRPCKSDELKKKLFRAGIKEKKCERCGIIEWLGNPAPLELDHINENHDDNRLENLQILCPNCHANKKFAGVA